MHYPPSRAKNDVVSNSGICHNNVGDPSEKCFLLRVVPAKNALKRFLKRCISDNLFLTVIYYRCSSGV